MEVNRGFTVVELVIILGLIGVVLLMMFTPIIFSYNNFDIQNEKANAIANARGAMDYLTRQIRKSSEVEVVDNTIILDSIVYKLKDRTLFKGDEKVIEGIDELIINKDNKRIELEIAIKGKRGEDYRLSSIINIR